MKNWILLIFFVPGIMASQTTLNISISKSALTILNASNGDTIIFPNSQKLWEPFSTSQHPRPSSIAPVITWTNISNGCNITYTFHNTSADTLSLGTIQIGGIRFDSIIYARNFAEEGDENIYNHHNANYTAYTNPYPDKLFSPVTAVRNHKYTLCMSLNYPVLKYKHNVDITLKSMNTQGGRNWTSLFQLNKNYLDSTVYSVIGDLMPGETRVYTLCLRIISNANLCESWLGALQPYKDYFRGLYGGTKYKNDRRPMKFNSIAASEFCDLASNPYCFSNYLTSNNLRPDIYGYGPLANDLINKYNALNYERLMLAKPTGVYAKNIYLNYPFKFTSHWLEGDTNIYTHSYGHKMGDAVSSLGRVAAPNRELGLWWGRSGQVMFDWDVNYFETLNPYDTVHVNRGFKELDLAVQAGATVIGLDAYRVYLPAWDGFVWLQMMRQRAPAVKFLTERWGCDILQTQAGMVALDQPFGNDKKATSPHYLADFLLPGSEKVVLLFDKNDSTAVQRAARMNVLNDWGYTVANAKDTLYAPYLAKETWYENNPYPDLGPDTVLCAGDTLVLNATHKNAVFYLWSTGSTANSIIVTTPGTYYVQTTTLLSCIYRDTVIIAACTPASVPEPSVFNTSVTLFPNPFHMSTMVKINNHEPGTEYEAGIYNSIGEEVKRISRIREDEFKLNFESISSGIYFLKIVNQQKIVTIKRMIVQ